MDNLLTGEALKSHGELVVLRLLVESMLMTMTTEDQAVATVKFQQACERLIAGMLGDAPRDELLSAIERAARWQWRRLQNLDAPIPPEALG